MEHLEIVSGQRFNQDLVPRELQRVHIDVATNGYAHCHVWVGRIADIPAEDMEYDACLTVAASESDSLRRIAFVAAFAMSNYSSTIGRIAKPFNPLLSQSFEYAIPNRYRYISEQVSHHPVSSLNQIVVWKELTITSLLLHVTVKHPSGNISEKSMPKTSSWARALRSDRQV